jgi:predicted transcriptional regulator
MNTTNEELIKFAKDQCEIFPEDSYMGKYLRETIKILEERTSGVSDDVMGNSAGLLYDLRDKYYSILLKKQNITNRKQMLDKLDVEFFTDLKNELLKKIKQTREEIDTDVRTTVKHFTNTDAVIDYVLDSIDELIEDE